MTTTKTILITGATTGIGRHAALHLAGRGLRVIASGRRRELLAALRAEAEAAGLPIDTVVLDVTDAATLRAAVLEVERLTDGRGLDGLVNNAGYGHPAPLSEMSDADLRRQFETNVFGLMATTRAFLPQLQRSRGRIVNLSSVGGRVTLPLFGAYNASKYAVESLSDALRLELAPFGVAVSIVEPGPIRSEFGARAMDAVQRDAAVTARSAYAPVLARADEIKAFMQRREAPPIVVSRAIEHALVARRPRARYVVPFSSRLMLVAARLLPVAWTDALLRRLVGLTPEALGQPAARCALPAPGR
jgi:NAD(P)-dependent dehydrogenase (short-subunit alcohol dehydrogenase family)